MLRVGIDTGGTFTDIVIVRGGAVEVWKEPSTPADPSAAILSGLLKALGGARPDHDALVVHGSTVATNALLEGKTARVAFVTNRGFEDLLEIGRQARPDLYNLGAERPAPLAPRELRFGVAGRLSAAAQELQPLDERELSDLAAALESLGVESAAVCLLHSYAEPSHERRAAAILAATGIPVSASCDLVPEHREYERASTAAVNAAVAPVMARYLERLAQALAPGAGRETAGPRLLVMGSNGGALSAAAAGREAVRTVLSGPAAGVRAAARVAADLGAARLIAFDMGGTSTDVSLIAGEPATAGSAVVAGHPVAVPALNIHTVGAGGGSIGWRDPGGALRVGPASAGAEPGPACYGKGGPATVTDANVLLGRIVPERFLDGRMPLDSGAARAAMEELGAGLRMTAEAAAEGMLEVAEATMARAVRVISLQRGHEPSDFALLAFGGAGGLHAAALASSLGMTEVIVPAHPGVFSAWGMTVADIMRDASASILRPAAEVQPGWLAARREALERDLLSLLASDGAPPGCVLFECRLDLRYAGQSFELTIPLPAPDRPQARLEAFHHEHRRRYGYDRPGAPVELVALRVRGIGRTGATPPGRVDPSGRSMHAAQAGRRPVLWRGRRLEASLYDRSRLPVSEASAGLPHGGTLQGPALILEGGATTFVPPGWRARLDPAGHLRLAAEPAR